jgi:pyrimidine-nucleoside phosphorylase
MEAAADSAGHISHINAQGVGLVSMHLGGGRATKDDTIDLAVGVVLHKKVGDSVAPGESLGTIYAQSQQAAQQAAEQLRACYTINGEPVVRLPFIKGVVK